MRPVPISSAWSRAACAFYHQRRTKTEDGRVYEYTRSYIRGDRVRLDVHMQKERHDLLPHHRLKP